MLLFVASLAPAVASQGACNVSKFAHPIQGVQCAGLKSNPNAKSSTECEQMCCEKTGCLSWVFQDGSAPSGCWMGSIPCAGRAHTSWSGSSSVPINPVPAPPVPPAPGPTCNGTGPLEYPIFDIGCDGLIESNLDTSVACEAACCASVTCQTWIFNPGIVNLHT